MPTKMSDIVAAGHTAAAISATDLFYVVQEGTGDVVLAGTAAQLKTFMSGGGGGGPPDFLPPLAADFPTEVNGPGGGTTITATDTPFGLALMVNQSVEFGDGLLGFFKAKPTTTDWHVDFRVKPGSHGQLALFFGLALLESSTGKAACFGLVGQSNNGSNAPFIPQSETFSNLTTSLTTTVFDNLSDNNTFFRLQFDSVSGNYDMLVSNDLVNFDPFITLRSSNGSIPFTGSPDMIGFVMSPHMSNSGSVGNIAMVVPYYKENG